MRLGVAAGDPALEVRPAPSWAPRVRPWKAFSNVTRCVRWGRPRRIAVTRRASFVKRTRWPQSPSRAGTPSAQARAASFRTRAIRGSLSVWYSPVSSCRRIASSTRDGRSPSRPRAPGREVDPLVAVGSRTSTDRPEDRRLDPHRRRVRAGAVWGRRDRDRRDDPAVAGDQGNSRPMGALQKLSVSRHALLIVDQAMPWRKLPFRRLS